MLFRSSPWCSLSSLFLSPFYFFSSLFLPYQPVPFLIGSCLFHDPLFRHPVLPSPCCSLSSRFLPFTVPSLSSRACLEWLAPFPSFSFLCPSIPSLRCFSSTLFLPFSVPFLSRRACPERLMSFPVFPSVRHFQIAASGLCPLSRAFLFSIRCFQTME